MDFNPRSPCGERLVSMVSSAMVKEFQPTLPMRGATGPSCSRRPKDHDFNPRSPSGERHRPPPSTVCREISTHAPHAGSDPSVVWVVLRKLDFNPRSPCGERRQSLLRSSGFPENFNPRSPCGERRAKRSKLRCMRAISTHAPHAGSDIVLCSF